MSQNIKKCEQYFVVSEDVKRYPKCAVSIGKGNDRKVQTDSFPILLTKPAIVIAILPQGRAYPYRCDEIIAERKLKKAIQINRPIPYRSLNI